jgi:hypothetical protein
MSDEAKSQQYRTSKEFLTALKAFFNDPSVHEHEHKNVYDVLTGLRGPDARDTDAVQDVKLATTSVIRFHTLGMPINKSCGAFVNPDSIKYFQIRTRNEPGKDVGEVAGFHFRAHARRAFWALGLDWETANPSTNEKKEIG